MALPVNKIEEYLAKNLAIHKFLLCGQSLGTNPPQWWCSNELPKSPIAIDLFVKKMIEKHVFLRVENDVCQYWLYRTTCAVATSRYTLAILDDYLLQFYRQNDFVAHNRRISKITSILKKRLAEAAAYVETLGHNYVSILSRHPNSIIGDIYHQRTDTAMDVSVFLDRIANDLNKGLDAVLYLDAILRDAEMVFTRSRPNMRRFAFAWSIAEQWKKTTGQGPKVGGRFADLLTAAWTSADAAIETGALDDEVPDWSHIIRKMQNAIG